MSADYMAEISSRQAAQVLEALRTESDLSLVSYGELAVSLQLPDAPSPHAIHLEATYAGGRLRLSFYMDDTEGARRRQWLVGRARARGIELELVAIASPAPPGKT